MTSDPMRTTTGRFLLKPILFLAVLVTCINVDQLYGQASKPRVNNEKPEKGKQSKRIHPHALKLILQGKSKEAIAYLESTAGKGVNPGHTRMLLDLAKDLTKAMNSGQIPVIKTSLERVIESETQKNLYSAVSFFKE